MITNSVQIYIEDQEIQLGTILYNSSKVHNFPMHVIIPINLVKSHKFCNNHYYRPCPSLMFQINKSELGPFPTNVN